MKYNLRNLNGKLVVDNLYIHRSWIASLPRNIYEDLLELDNLFFENKWGIGYNIIKISTNGDVSFILSNEFDTVDEPRIDVSYIIKNKMLVKTIDYSKYKREGVPIYHHKWIFVSHGYKGFDVKLSEERSKWWEKHPVVIKHMQEDKYFKSRIGSYGYWNKLLKEIDEYEGKRYRVKLSIYVDAKNDLIAEDIVSDMIKGKVIMSRMWQIDGSSLGMEMGE